MSYGNTFGGKNNTSFLLNIRAMDPVESSIPDSEASAVADSLISLRESPAVPSSATTTVGGTPITQKEVVLVPELYTVQAEGND